jgi:hypothetical protein
MVGIATLLLARVKVKGLEFHRLDFDLHVLIALYNAWDY